MKSTLEIATVPTLKAATTISASAALCLIAIFAGDKNQGIALGILLTMVAASPTPRLNKAMANQPDNSNEDMVEDPDDSSADLFADSEPEGDAAEEIPITCGFCGQNETHTPVPEFITLNRVHIDMRPLVLTRLTEEQVMHAIILTARDKNSGIGASIIAALTDLKQQIKDMEEERKIWEKLAPRRTHDHPWYCPQRAYVDRPTRETYNAHAYMNDAGVYEICPFCTWIEHTKCDRTGCECNNDTIGPSPYKMRIALPLEGWDKLVHFLLKQRDAQPEVVQKIMDLRDIMAQVVETEINRQMRATEYRYDPDDSWIYSTPSIYVLYHYLSSMPTGDGRFMVQSMMHAAEPTQEQRESDDEPPKWWTDYVNDDVLTGRDYHRARMQRDAERNPDIASIPTLHKLTARVIAANFDTYEPEDFHVLMEDHWRKILTHRRTDE